MKNTWKDDKLGIEPRDFERVKLILVFDDGHSPHLTIH